MSIEKIPSDYLANNAAWTPINTVGKKVNDVIDELNSITDGDSDGTFENISVTDTSTLDTVVITGEILGPDDTYSVAIGGLIIEDGHLQVNKTAAVQDTSITTGVIVNNRSAFSITTVSSTLATNTSATFTVTSNLVTANSIIMISAATAGTGIPVATVLSKTAGSFDVKLYNSGTAAFNNTIRIDFWVLQ